MNLKDKLVKKLLNVGKKHRILVYPTLALIAVISAVSHIVYWGRGNGKKLTASLMVVVMLITQSIFLTSSAGTNDSDKKKEAAAGSGDVASPGDADTDDVEIPKGTKVQVIYHMVYPYTDSSGVAEETRSYDYTVFNSTNLGTLAANVEIFTNEKKGQEFFNDKDKYNYIEFSNCYTNPSDKENSRITNIDTQNCSEIPVTVDKANARYNAIHIYFDAKRIAYPVAIYDSDGKTLLSTGMDLKVNVVPYGQANSNIVPNTANVDKPYGPDPLYPDIRYTVNNDIGGFTRWGYSLSALTYGGVSYEMGNNFDMRITEGDDTIRFSSVWKPMTYTLTFVAYDDGTGNWPSGLLSPATDAFGNNPSTQTYNKITYDENSTRHLFSDSDCWARNEAYALTGWYYVDGSDLVMLNAGTDVSVKADFGWITYKTAHVSDSPNILGRTLYAKWEYRDVDLTTSNNSDENVEVTSDANGINVKGTYGDNVKFTITPEYKSGDKTGTKFTYELTEDATNTLKKYGLTSTETKGSVNSLLIQGTFNDITGNNTIVVPIKVIDGNVKDGNEKKSVEYNIYINIGKRHVHIDETSIKGGSGSNAAPRKEYDGLTSIAVNDRVEVKASDVLSQDRNDLYVTVSTTATLYDDDNDSTNDADASDNGRKIKLNNVQLAGAKASYYVLVDDAGNEIKTTYNVTSPIATVTRRSISVTITNKVAGEDTIWFGQATPEYTLTINNINDLAGDETKGDKYGYLNRSGDERDRYVKNLLGFVDFSITPQRGMFSPVATYTVGLNCDKSHSNYNVQYEFTYFEVKQETGSKNVNYKYSTEQAENGFYPGLTITPIGGFTLIREIKDGEQPINENNTAADIGVLFKNEISIDDCVNKNIRFQLCRYIDPSNPSKGFSITGVINDTVSVDTTKPTYISHAISTNRPDVIINKLDFGTYSHSQNGVESITIDFIYESNYSDCKTLYYYFLPEGSTKKGAEIYVDMTRIPNTGNRYTATVTVGTGYSGQLIVYAKNSTGLISQEKKIWINKDGVGQATDFNGVDPSNPTKDYYEWMVENEPLTAENIVVMDANGKVITDKDKWYNGIYFSVDARDSQSGVNRIEWKIVDAEGNEVSADKGDVIDLTDVSAVVKNYGKVTAYTFRNSISVDTLPVTEYYVSATAYDNAGNKTELAQVGPFKVDCKPPVITDATPATQNQYISNVEFEFTVTEEAYESGVDTVMIIDITEDENNKAGIVLYPYNNGTAYKYKIDKNGTYKISATDKAGNESTYIRTFGGISNVSPDKPVISVNGIKGNDGWYKEELPELQISAASQTSDRVPVTTFYEIDYPGDGDDVHDVISSINNTLNLPFVKEGIVNVKAWSVSASGVKSEEAEFSCLIDITAPEITIIECVTDENDISTVKYKVTDKLSGVRKVFIDGKEVKVDLVDGVAMGSFVIEQTNAHVISAVDIAGNVSEELEYIPLSVKANSILNIKPTSAHLEFDLYEGTYPVDKYYVSYKKQGDKAYSTALCSGVQTDYGLHVDCDFRKLTQNTIYDYRIYAITKTSREVCVVYGSFKTGSSKASASIKGSAIYSEEIMDEYNKYPVFVNVYEGNVIVAGKKIESEADSNFEFTNLPNGSYRITASDGLLSKTSRVVITNGGIQLPQDYFATNGINFVLDGFSTDVVIGDSSINIAADGLDKVFDSMGFFEGIITREDKAVIADGGSVKITLHANVINEASIPKDELKQFKNNMSKDEHIQRYIDIYVEKTVKDINGKLVYEPERLPQLYDDIELSFPLLDLAGQDVYVAMTHAEANGDYTFKKWEDVGEVILSQNFVTISTNLFSTYALYTVDKSQKTHIVKWMADGKVVKTEIVSHGKTATPPNKTPVKKDTDVYSYIFGGWNLSDYSNITEDTIITAWFIKTRKDENTEEPSTTEDKPGTTENPSTETPGHNPITTEDNNPATTEDNNHTTTEDPIGTEPVKDVYLGTDSNPQTGDEAPIAVMALLMVLSLAGAVVLKKCNKDE